MKTARMTAHMIHGCSLPYEDQPLLSQRSSTTNWVSSPQTEMSPGLIVIGNGRTIAGHVSCVDWDRNWNTRCHRHGREHLLRLADYTEAIIYGFLDLIHLVGQQSQLVHVFWDVTGLTLLGGGQLVLG